LHQKRHLAWKSGNWLTAPPQYHKPFSEIQFIESRLNEPLHWRNPQVVFVCPQADLFHEAVPIETIAEVFGVMSSVTTSCGKRHEHEAECWQGDPHVFLILTKRAERMKRVMELELAAYASNYLPGDCPLNIGFEGKWPPDNWWFGVSVCGPEDEGKIGVLCDTLTANRWVSYEPALGPVNWGWIRPSRWPLPNDRNPPIECVIAGCESGPGARPSEVDWFRVARDACAAANVPFHLKQMMVDGKLVHLPYLDGRQYTELPWRKA
jgi:protein gp37